MADNFDSEINALAASVPVALLPVRLEARFFDNARELRLRVYPDQIHVDAHEPRLTSVERDAGIAYWQQRAAVPNPVLRAASPWLAIAGPFGAARAAWVVQTLTPENLPAAFGPGSGAFVPVFPATPLQDATWSSAACAAALPKRWLVLGRRGGATLFRKWSTPIATPLDLTPTPLDDGTPLPDNALPLQDSARWLVDFDVAEKAGMALRIVAADLPSADALTAGLDRILVLGVASALTPEKGAASLRTLLSAHIHTDGLSALQPGTPTNVSRDSTAAAAPDAAALAAALDPEKRPTASAFNGSGGDRLWRAFGFGATVKDILSAVPGATGFEALCAAHMGNALWESTLGSWLIDFLKPMIEDAAATQVRDHVRQHLVPAGPMPALRIGRQPYGVLPVIAADRFLAAKNNRFETELLQVLRKLRVLWTDAVARVPRLSASNDFDADLTRVLQSTPLSSRYQWRPVLGPLALNASQGLERHAAAQETLTELLGVHLGWKRRPDLAGFAAHPQSHPLRVPLVDEAAAAPAARLSRNYLSEIATLARSSGEWDAIKEREKARTLLEALAAHAVARELHRADMRTLDRQRLSAGAISALPAVGLMAASEYVAIESITRPAASAGALITTPAEAARSVIPSITADKTVRQFVTAAIARGVRPTPDYAVLGDMLSSMEFLATRSVGELDRALRGWLDACAWRLDAWFTSLAQRRLATLRTAQPNGLHLGAYGWLDDLRPDASPQATTQGYVHAPSLAQAATAAVLRSGHLAHHDAEHQALQIDLRSDRVRRAAQLLGGVAAGQPLAALLGYRFERALRERNLLLARFILPLRRLFPLRPTGETVAPPAGASETLAARDVVDGVALLQAWRDQQAALFTRLVPAPDANDTPLLADELNRLTDLYDAVADLMVAEAVHQNVLGNNDRAGAAIAALDRQERPPTLDFVRTPRSGTAYTQRLLVLLGDAVLPPTWTALGNDARARAEPRLSAWVARLLGNPARFVLAANLRAGGTVKPLTLALPVLGLSPLSLVMASRGSSQQSTSELEARVLLSFAKLVTAPTPDTEIELLDAPAPAANALGLGAVRALLQSIHALVTGQRAAHAQDLALPRHVADGEGVDAAELGLRAQACAAAHATALTALRNLRAQPAATATALRNALLAAAAFGLHEALPAPPAPAGQAAAERAALHEQCAALIEVMSERSAREQALAGQAAGALTLQAAANLHIERTRVLLGQDFPMLPLFQPGHPADLAASLAARSSLLGGDEPAPLAWLQRMGLVRDDSARLATVMQGAELTGGDITSASLAVMQLPARPGERWLALPFGTTPPATAELAITAAVSGVLDPTKPWAGLFVDGWPETIPAREETTGIAFHHDAPGARAPQAVLLAVPPDAAAPTWNVDDLLATIDEAHDLARLRAVGPKDLHFLGTLLPALLLPASLSDDVPGVRLEALAALAPASSGVLGKT